MKIKLLLILFVCICISASSFSQARDNFQKYKLNWEQNAENEKIIKAQSGKLFFKGARIGADYQDLPVFYLKWPINGQFSEITTTIQNSDIANVDIPVSNEQKSKISDEFIVKSQIITTRKKKWAIVELLPFRKNKRTGKIEKLVSFDLNHQLNSQSSRNSSSVFASNSILNSGTWYKIAVTSRGIHKISADFFTSQLGIPLNSINPKNIRIYGNGGGMLPAKNSSYRHDDLVENAVLVLGENDGVFNAGDYVLFYGEKSDQWVFNESNNLFEHVNHLYSDTTYYFINLDLGPGKRISSRASSSQNPTNSVTTFNDYAVHEADERNFIKSGREWYGETFNDIQSSRFFEFNFPGLVLSEPVFIKSAVAARAFSPSSFDLKYNSQTITNQGIAATSSNYLDFFAKLNTTDQSFNANSSLINIELKYNYPNPSAIGYLDKLVLNVRRQLTLTGNQMIFRDANSVGLNNYSKFEIKGTTNQVQIWDVSDPLTPVLQEYNYNNGTTDFVVQHNELREFVVFNGSNFPSPKFRNRVVNQNLHSLADHDYVIVAHPLFLQQANQLGDIHRQMDNMKVAVVTTDQVYNEFSSGARDVSAIRDFLRMFYERALDPKDIVKYVCLFGDGSYDNRSIITDNTNFIPSYQSRNSTSPINSYVSDDFYVLLDTNEGNWLPGVTEALDMGIGRIPVKSTKEAQVVIDKIEQYLGISKTSVTCNNGLSAESIFGDWRNVIMFVADDEDSNTHIADADKLTKKIKENDPVYNIEKVYFDSFEQQSNAGGQRFPQVTEAIKQRIEKGVLFINYTGHGGELGWAHEGVLTIDDINGWNNPTRFPAFMTATCEFARYDDPARTSAGEIVYLRENGGGIALLTTVRLVTSIANAQLNNIMYGHIFKRVDGELPRLGDVMRLTKNDYLTNNTRNFTLLGDPALRLAYPELNVRTTEINNQSVTTFIDTLKAFSKVTIKGEVLDLNDQKMTTFNGFLYPSIFDKAATITTLSNDPGSPAFNFEVQSNVIYRGKASVTDGEFEFSFIIPKDISYKLGYGKISYYAHNNELDAHGYHDTVIIGGISDSLLVDTEGPVIQLYMNDNKFAYGGITSENPFIYAEINDENGINTTGIGIGHDITATLDNATDKLFVLNDFYESDLNSYQTGKVKYPLNDLVSGRHNVKLKVWDILNNSSESTTEFVVASSAKLALDHVLNYPNPFTTNTQFFFEHNKDCSSLFVQIQIYTVSGKLVKTLEQYVNTSGFRSDPVEWDGTDDFGENIGKGVYVYRLKVRDQLGEVASKTEKLVLLK